MYKDNQDRVDAYLRGEMDTESKIQFEKELNSDQTLHAEYLQTKAISDAIADRKEKLNMMARWDQEEEIRLRLVSRRNIIRRWTIGMSAAACVAVGFFAIRPMFVTSSSSPGSDFVMPSFGNDAYYRGGDSSMEILDSLIIVKDYEKALAYADSLIINYNQELKTYESKESLTEKDEYNKEMCEEGLQDLEWRRANLLVALNNTTEAKEVLRYLNTRNGLYQNQADSLLQTLTKQ